MEVVRPGSRPKYLQNLDRKITALLAEGVDLVYVVTFDYEFSQQSAEEFIQQTLAGPSGRGGSSSERLPLRPRRRG